MLRRGEFTRSKIEPRLITIETRDRCARALTASGDQLSEKEADLMRDLVARHSLNVPVTKAVLDTAMGILGKLRP